jgi:hypothetical protein
LLQFIKIFLYIVSLLRLLLYDFITASDPSGEVIDITLVHLAFSDVILLAFKVLCEIIKEHLSSNPITVILLFRG